MQSRAGLLAALAMLGTALAGCSGSDSDSGLSSDAIDVENAGPPGGPGPYTFTAAFDSDDGNYTWDLGDRMTVMYGKSVTHTYDFENSAGNVTVILRAKRGGVVDAEEVSFRLGTGVNAKPAFALDAETNWAVVGEPVRFSAARSTDTDGGPLRYSWACVVNKNAQDLQRQEVHTHGNVGTPFSSPPSGSVTSYLVNPENYTWPAEALAIPGDLCAALGDGTDPSTGAATIQGAFAQRGWYVIYLFASDGANPTVSGSFEIIATDPQEKPSEWVDTWFNQTLQLGGDGRLQGTCDGLPPEPQSCDRFSGSFELPLQGLYGWVNVTYAPNASVPDQSQAANQVTWNLTRSGGKTVASGGPETPSSKALIQAQLPNARYVVQGLLKQGVLVDVQVHVQIRQNLDPFTVY